ncbi:MAG: hypothetical protein AUI47_06330 [Acidobacteria bacterium 13_1_40CM_2_68_5]|nr:MAG: hypothetical protein AUI47_06330 [Acidobacteria bacterium 13_1_40CM_2_68_5]
MMICGDKWPRQILVFLVFILMSTRGTGAAAKPDVTQFVAVIDFDCTAPSSLPQGELAHLARQTTQKLGSRGVAVWADRAWALDLGGEPEPEYLVPLDCGATGNFRWAVLASGPVRLLGTVDGALIYVHARNSGWSELTGYASMGAGDGVGTSYVYRNGGYVAKSEHEVRDAAFEKFAQSYGLQSHCEK